MLNLEVQFKRRNHWKEVSTRGSQFVHSAHDVGLCLKQVNKEN